MRPVVVIGFLGTTLDAGRYEKRWNRWRPTVALCRQPGLPVDRLELLLDEQYAPMAETVVNDIRVVSPYTLVVPRFVKLADPWDFEEMYAALHDFVRDYPFDPEKEEYLVNITTGTHVAQICWFLLTEAHDIPGKILQLSPPAAGSGDTAGSHAVIDLDLSRYDRIANRFQAEQREAASFLKSGIDTRNDMFNRLIDHIERVAVRSSAPILLTGPTGAGKSQLARRIYDLKKLRYQVSGPFVEVNCATLRGDTAMSTLFGHVRGAFTGAQADRPGLLKTAEKGVLFLDEIGELGPDEQAMILRAVEDKCFLPLGSDREVKSDFHLIAGTNRDLGEAVRKGTFREDLFARLNLWFFNLPGLRHRREDIAPNIDYECQRFAEREGQRVSFNREAKERYLAFALSEEAVWSANFRDLSASITRMAILATNARINLENVEEEISRLRDLWRAKPSLTSDEAVLDQVLGTERAAQLDLFDKTQLAAVVRICRDASSLSAAGRILFAVSRTRKTSGNDADRLKKYLARFDLDWKDVHG
ncbi:MAG: RNA repair transcriptional activator RtcR [Methylobacteriaceae bacterium]|jgi:transcriptional regulatory protein RtcR|nr:RNA repair transcriptional activator RtcR [Methylobacteriaceae bacterium]